MKIFGVVLLVIVLVVGGYFGYQYYQKWQDNQKSNELKIMEVLKANQGIIIKLTTELAEIQKKVVGDTLKETIVIKEEAPTYESEKDKLIELRKDPVVNEEKIKVARVEFEERINEFQASPDKILINTGEEKIVIYEDDQGNLVSLESGITITRHRDVKEVIGDLQEGKKVETGKAKDWKLKAGGYYDITEKEAGIIISKEILGFRDYSLNASILSDVKDLEGINLGANINYSIKDNLELGVGITIDKDYFIVLEYSF